MIIKKIPFASKTYEEMKRFREDILRLPLGLKLSVDDLIDEDTQIHIAAIEDGGSIVGTILLKPVSQNRVKLRQMAVLPSLQQRGIGRKLVSTAEESARAMGFTIIELHARIYAKGFYEKLGYQMEGDTFIEVNLPTAKMIKRLTL
jgi:predicted N-acetyltransferase YhbS